jgi:exonuclease III
MAIVLDAFAAHRRTNRPHILCGDFNAVSPAQEIEPSRLKASSKEEYEANGNRLAREVVQRLLDEGYIDTLSAVDVEASKRNGTFSTQQPGQRVDYIFAWGVKREFVRKAWIEYDRLAKYASDHFPVGAEIE